ncbi:hypothetical protein [Streptomyces jeddahensis]|uniref:Uncharacterized protein n=1 Tax=Streptomyces jeddahensis TaxID=1716141 RepID=A0A177HFZ4_9ACTN|nr:hypothetical protein [Streptomyces jeddahensis]OAH09882.1 hypothetical protein STSP_68810 [Streptomyces jeddahensis]
MLILVILGRLAARYTEPVALRLTGRRGKSEPASGVVGEGVASPAEAKEAVDDQDAVGRS